MKKHLWKTLSLLWSFIIVYFSFRQPPGTEGITSFEHQDKLGHFLFYAILAYLLINTFKRETSIENPLLFSIIVGFTLGVIVEFFQHYATTDREGSIMDALANGLGLLAVVLIVKKNPKIFFSRT